MPYTREYLLQLPEKERAEKVGRILDEYIRPKLNHVLDAARQGKTSHFIEIIRRLQDHITNNEITIEEIQTFLHQSFPDSTIEYLEDQTIGRQGARLLANGFRIDWSQAK